MGVQHLSFNSAILVFPVAVVVHVLEEWPRFPRWARRFASPRYSDREYALTHALAVLGAVIAVAILRAFPAHCLLSAAFFAIVFGPGVFWNAWFHAGATVLTRTYCPGVVTGLAVYLPLSILLIVLAVRDGLVTPRFLFIAFGIGALVHIVEVGHTVFKRW